MILTATAFLQRWHLLSPENRRPPSRSTPLRNALSRSYNIPAIKVMEQVAWLTRYVRRNRMGINDPIAALNFCQLSLVLGGGEVSLLDHTYAHTVFTNSGNMALIRCRARPWPMSCRAGYRTLEPVSVLQVRDSDGNLLKSTSSPTPKRAFSAEVAVPARDIA